MTQTRNRHLDRPKVRVMAKVDRVTWNRAKAIAALQGISAERWLEGVIVEQVKNDRNILTETEETNGD